MARQKKEIIPTKKCVHCGHSLEYKHFHNSNSGIYMGNGNLVPVCKGCFKILYEQYRIQYMDQFSVLGTEPGGDAIKKLAIRRLCMMFDIYYSDRLFEAAIKNQEKFINIDLPTAYMRIANLKQNKNKTYDNAILEENLSQGLAKPPMAEKCRKQFDNSGLYQNIYGLCLELLQLLRNGCNTTDGEIPVGGYSINN